MIKRIEQWLARVFRAELAKATADLAALQAEFSALRAELKEHTTDAVQNAAVDIKAHAKEAADQLHARIAEDAKAIVKFQQTVRLGCSFCGQLTRTYLLTGGKIKCVDCQKKGVE